MRTLWRLIASFFKWTWRILNFIRKLALNAIFLVLVLVCIGIWSQFSSTTSEHAARGALLLDITGVVVDKPSASSKLGVIGRQLFGASSDRLQENSLFDIVQTIRQAKDDRNITGIVLDLKNFVGGDQPSMQYIGKALREFRDSGKTGVCRRQQLQPGPVLPGELRQQNLALAAGRGRPARLRYQRAILQIAAG